MSPCALLFWCQFAAFSTAAGTTNTTEKVRYVRPAGEQFVAECEFDLARSKTGLVIHSVTRRGPTKMTVTSRYDDKDMLAGGEATLLAKDQKKAVTVRVTAGKTKVERDGQQIQEFDVPRGVIVTSAPDWTDTFLLCQRYDRKKGGKQSFAGLWIHPIQPAQRLTFAIQRQTAQTIEHAGKKRQLDRFTIGLRGNSSYAAWADGEGRMIKLVPLPFKQGATNWLVLEGYEKSAAGLWP